ncbi:MAG: DUF3987 domain-containing protein, partial [Candidatus Marinimicrobia bacterium]|nr:DUF3987 domain-containing protein [Candidatus Neomarinimicrobiota bacterium]
TGDLIQALYIWNEWSQAGTKYQGKNDILTCWQSFKADSGISLGTLFHIAGSYGWTRPIPDASELFSAVNDASGQEWAEPLDLINRYGISEGAYNREHWPEVIADKAEETSLRIGSDPLMAAWSGLAHIMPVCSDIHQVQPKKHSTDYTERPALWMMAVGEPSCKKSPTDRDNALPLKSCEKELVKHYQIEREQYLAKKEFHKIKLDAWKTTTKKTHAADNHNAAETISSIPTEPLSPANRRLTVSNVTVEKLADMLSDNTGGLTFLADELAALFNSMGQYKSGTSADQQLWLEMYAGGGYTIDRKGSGSTYIDNWSIGIYGTIQPDVLKGIFSKKVNDGLLQRFIIIYVNEAEMGKDIPVNQAVMQRYERAVERLFTDHKIYQNGELFSNDYPDCMRPNTIYTLTDKAYDISTIARERIDALRYSGLTKYIRQALSKVEGQMFRIALLFHLIEWADSEEIAIPKQITRETMKKAADLTTESIIPSMIKFHSELMDSTSDAQAIAKYIISRDTPLSVIKERDIYRDMSSVFGNVKGNERQKAIDSAMSDLIVCDWVKPIIEVGHKRSNSWIINPKIYTSMLDTRNAEVKKLKSIKQKMNQSHERRKQEKADCQ